MTIDELLYKQLLDHNTKLVGIDKLCCFNLDEECVMVTGKNIKIVGSQNKKSTTTRREVVDLDSVTDIR